MGGFEGPGLNVMHTSLAHMALSRIRSMAHLTIQQNVCVLGKEGEATAVGEH